MINQLKTFLDGELEENFDNVLESVQVHSMEHVRCAAHVSNLIFQEFCTHNKELRSIIDKVKQLVKTLRTPNYR